MPLTPNVVDGQIILASWGNQIRDRSIQRFTTVAERDSAWPPATAGAGAQCVTLDTLTRWVSTGTVWTAAMPTSGMIPALGADAPMATTDTYISTSVTLNNARIGNVATVVATCGVKMTVAGAACVLKCGYTPPGGGVVAFGGPSTAYLGATTIQTFAVAVIGRVVLNVVGDYQFYLLGSSSTGSASIVSGQGFGIATITPA